MDELVEQMLDAYWQDCRPCEMCEAGQRTGMTAAAKVLLEAARAAVLEQRCKRGTPWDMATLDAVEAVARLLAPKTLEERITVVPTNIANYSNVFLDGKNVGPGSMRNDYAQTFAKGLITEMKEKGCSSK